MAKEVVIELGRGGGGVLESCEAARESGERNAETL